VDWRLFFSKVGFLKYILIFLAILILLGIVIISACEYKIISAIFIFLLAVITSYLKSIGLAILWINKRYKAKTFIFVDSVINIIIVVLFGYRYLTILSLAFWAYISYIVFWAIYMITTYLKLIKNVNYYSYYLRDKR
jgi:hypothetical protein